MNFQSVIALLHHFWGERGCLIAQPYDIDIPNVVVMSVVHLAGGISNLYIDSCWSIKITV
ncbi:hypothetical protein [Nostoc sp. LEGE 12447]|uniref:hypothetical protein n=1 Tax=Nostoc sp. LEGE 12447 TaxID=1828640 RepID=UPI002AD3D643|nr:hypothetical protein [Nostoc sp. LEGE 12447]